MQQRVLSLSLFLLCLAFFPFAQAQDRAPSLALRGADGRQHTLRQYRGKIVVLNFWATWCAPCLHEMPVLTGLYSRYSGKGLIILGASIDEASSLDRVDAVVRKYKIGYPIFVDVAPETIENFGLDNVPAMILLDRSGRIIARISGEADPAALKHQIDALLSDHSHSSRVRGTPAP
jgi:thiol-disulfide isomerase/thioredoxin